MARKRVSATWSKRNVVPDTQAWRTLADCLGYHTPYMETPQALGARVIRNFTNDEEVPHVGVRE